MAFLEATRTEREAMAATASTRAVRESVFHLRRDLEKIFARTDLTHREKRRLYFDLWDECAEKGSAERVRLARQVRATILAFVRRRYPHGSSTGYSDHELAELNASRESTEPFRPYSGSGQSPPAGGNLERESDAPAPAPGRRQTP
jgi:hypothetical protein